MLELTEGEKYWRDIQPWLKLRGYQLRARYQPDWAPSWVTNPPKEGQSLWGIEDYHARTPAKVMDAVRILDNKPVMLKPIAMPGVPENYELSIIHYLSNPDICQDPQNKCVPIYEVLYNIPDDPERAIIVMPLLRPFNDPRFDTVGECLSFFQQIFIGLQFLHRHHIAHRDCSGPNVMIDASDLYPDGFHPYAQHRNREHTGSAVQKYTRTERPPKYYWIDFGLSVRFELEEPDQVPRVGVLRGNDKSPPEFQSREFIMNDQDPFPTDVYYLGNLVRRYFTEGWPELRIGKKRDFSFMEPLVQAMVQSDPAKRPTMDQCVAHLDQIIRSQSSWKLRSQVWQSTDNIFGFIYRFFPHWVRRITYIVTQTPAIPKAI